MTRQEHYTDLQGHDYYERKERKNEELVDCMVTGAIWLIIVAGLLSIAGHVKELWGAYASCF